MVMGRRPSCSKNRNVPDKYAGKRVKCPACQGILTVPEMLEEVIEEEAVEVVPVKPGKPVTRRVSEEDDEEEERIVQRTRALVPGRLTTRTRTTARGGRNAVRLSAVSGPIVPTAGAPMPFIRYTFWGGIIGPLFINTVRRRECGTNYNGVHGDYNTTRIMIFVLIYVGLALVIGGGAVVVEMMKSLT